ncbi:SDR family NAD(P)-dependent oxidoreductase [Saccharibacillus sp. CPCC 101409]|uniref:SDR family NAD(P)-dependent oxidoreductase n=1 Tax=Saccharibacillus sp. CPCC 101409 TaxID=3058041 RepID=UPI0026724F63|nr:SDR family NAD(P)-dependent oxidoreductase [Saccharibacillus sp. CPCC 101409]MDO3412400.1 SDR family NAD(P)-dependent oxidoreductase [Saccharibacillus sp. CPCC 101409]
MSSINAGEKRPVAVLTASYSGIGTELSKMLAAAGYDLILINRSPERTIPQLKQLRSAAPSRVIEPIYADLSDHAQIRQAAEQIAEKRDRIDLLIHNAGIAGERLELSVQGNDLHYEVNTFAPYLLTELLRPQLAAADHSVVVAVGSSAMRMAHGLDLPQLRVPRKFKRFRAYAHTKLATAAAFQAMADDYAQDRISLRIADPGPTRTAMSMSGAMPFWFPMIRWYFVSPVKGAERIHTAATATVHPRKGAAYFEFGRPALLPKAARNTETADRLMEILRSSRHAD